MWGPVRRQAANSVKRSGRAPPAPIAEIAFQNNTVVYGILFKAAAETLRLIAADPKHLGAALGLVAVPNTWGQNLHLPYEAELALEAEARVARLGYPNVEIRVGDGSRGWADHAPLSKILVAAAAEVVPPR